MNPVYTQQLEIYFSVSHLPVSVPLLFVSSFNFFRLKFGTYLAPPLCVLRVPSSLTALVHHPSTEVTPESERLKTRTTWNPNEKFEQILSQNPNAALESERPARCSCMFVRTFPQRSATHTSDPQALYKWYLSKGHKKTKNADTRTTRNAVTWCYHGRWLTFHAIISLLLQLLHAPSSFLFKVNTGFYIFNFINLHFYSNIIIIC